MSKEQLTSRVEDFKSYIVDAVQVGNIIYPSSEVVGKLQKVLSSDYEKPERLFSKVEDVVLDEIYRTKEEIKGLTGTKKLNVRERIMKSLAKKEPENESEKAREEKRMYNTTKLIYLAPIMMEAMANSEKYNMGKSSKEIATMEERNFFMIDYPFIRRTFTELVRNGVERDWKALNLIKIIRRKESEDWLRDQWNSGRKM